MSSKILLEVCVETLESAESARTGGADRIELNSALALGGLTPTDSLLQQVKASTSLPVICMIRPRPGNFYYSDSEFALMQKEAESLLAAGAGGLAIGCLDADGRVDCLKVKTLRQTCESRELVFHRAFDCSSNLEEAITSLIDLGIDRVLTSGGQGTAIEGQSRIAALQRNFGDRIEILPGSGINISNVTGFLQATQCRQVHGTFREIYSTGARFPSAINFNEIMGLAAEQKFETSREQIQRMVELFTSLDT